MPTGPAFKQSRFAAVAPDLPFLPQLRVVVRMALDHFVDGRVLVLIAQGDNGTAGHHFDDIGASRWFARDQAGLSELCCRPILPLRKHAPKHVGPGDIKGRLPVIP